ncbi:MAG: hypothetical protein KDE31_00485, partial [Caldilineaceae bacterium]|nr:hypothetical protein [Caldilineaceae bacterium]
LLSMLSHKFGTLPDEFIRQINAITDQHILTQISNQILDAGHLSEIVLPPLDEEQSQTGE